MAQIQLTDRARQIAYELQFNGDLSNQELAERLGLKPHVVQYTKNQLIESSILRRTFYLNPYALGLQTYQILFSSWGKSSGDDEAISFLKSHWRTAWFAVIAGQYQYAMDVVATSPTDLSLFLDDVESKFGEVFSSKTVAVMQNYVMISKKYLLTEIGITPEDVQCIDLSRVLRHDLETVDLELVRVLAQNPYESQRQLAQIMGIPKSTLNFRLGKLKEMELLSGSFHFVSATRMRRVPFLIQIQTVGARKKIRKAIYAFAKANPQVVNLAEIIGSWDFQLTLEVLDQRDLNETIKLLYRASKRIISQITSITIISQQKSPEFLALPRDFKRIR